MSLLSLLAVLCLATIHLLVVRLRHLEPGTRRRLLSLAGGASVAYVFLHLMPQLAAAEAEASWLPTPQFHFLAALAGLVAFYGLERHLRGSARPPPHDTAADEPRGSPHGGRVFWTHVGGNAVYNLVIGHLLLRHGMEREPVSMLLFAGAMGLHFLAASHTMRLEHRLDYDRTVRWLLAGAVLLGWLAGLVVTVPAWALDLLYAALAGGIVLSVLRDELPGERRSDFRAFVVGAAGYAGPVLALG